MGWAFGVGAAAGCAAGLLARGSFDMAALAALVFIFLTGVWLNERDSDVIEVER
jgi:hypothetical protein